MYRFEWDLEKEKINIIKHGVTFHQAQHVFTDENRVFIEDIKHSQNELRLFCIGKVDDKVLTVRFTKRGDIIRIIGAAEWRKWRKFYEQRYNYD